ncbi:CoA transferase [Streptomyces sp. MUM 203J]|nr:CoA transferase [Streptomyces sp. MUM 203J]
MVQRISYGPGMPGVPTARLPVMALARATVAVCSLAAAEFAAVRAGGGGTASEVPRVRVDDGAVATAFHSERHIRLEDRGGETFAPLSRFWRTADGWVRTHANYPHHRERLLAALGLPAGAGVEAVAAELERRRALDVEEAVYGSGGLAVAVRGSHDWTAGPQGALVAEQPLLTLAPLGDAPPVPPRTAPRDTPSAPPGAAPCAGLRVLDLTRVLAGPVATRTLALLGADVLRIDTPRLAESQEIHHDTGLGKRSALLDLGRSADRELFEDLLVRADVVVTGYRPGALDRFGLSAEALAARRPGVVVAELSAWGRSGPWGGRRGFDSLVQAATGIALREGSTLRPGVLPAQALDHGTGYLLAAAVLRALTERQRGGGTWLVRATLARTAHWLLHELDDAGTGEAAGTAGTPGEEPYEPEPWLVGRDSPLGRVRHARSPVMFEGGPRDWARPAGRWGTDLPRWTS